MPQKKGWLELNSRDCPSLQSPKESGFTLIEILVAISIVAIAFSVVILSSQAILKRTRDTQRSSDIKKIQAALQQYYTDYQYFPSSFDLHTATELTNCTGRPTPCTITKTYLSKVPQDPTPTTDKHYCYQAFTSVAEYSSYAVNTPYPLSSCDNTTNAKFCNYYILQINLETGSVPVSKCNAGVNGTNDAHLGNQIIEPL